jgi:hypothetical protein
VVVVVGEVPDEIRVPRKKYIDLLSRLDTAIHECCPHEVELASEILDNVRTWAEDQPLPITMNPLGPFTGTSSEVDGQLELPLDWDDRAGR